MSTQHLWILAQLRINNVKLQVEFLSCFILYLKYIDSALYFYALSTIKILQI